MKKHRMSRLKGVVLLQELAEGLGLLVLENAVRLDGALPAQVEEAILRFLDAGTTLNVQVKFSLGDLYNTLSDRHGAKKQFVEAHFPAERAEKVYKQLRQYGWVANKWPARERLKDLPWQHYVVHYPNDFREEKEVRPSTVVREIVDMTGRGSSLEMNWAEDTQMWEVSFISDGIRYCGLSRSLLTALKEAHDRAQGVGKEKER